MHLHILGVCGTFMAGVAVIAKQQGLLVSGSDRQFYSPMQEQLEAAGIDNQSGFEQLVTADHYLVGNIISRGMPITEALLASDKPYDSAPAWLYQRLLKDRRVIAIAGTHGKTTTTAMVAWILDYCGYQAGFLIGGIANNFNCSARLGRDSADAWFVIEADEYDTSFFDKRPKFMHYHPDILLINNLEFDHADIYADVTDIQRQFHFLIRTLKPSAKILIQHHYQLVRELIDQGAWSEVIEVVECWGQQAASLQDRLLQQLKQVGLEGQHNLENAMAAVAVSKQVGVDQNQAVEALAQFQGIKRRQEVLGRWLVNGASIRLISDFAHHPTAIRYTLSALKASQAEGRLLVLFDPASNSMKAGVHNAQLAEAFAQADWVFMLANKNLNWSVEEVLDSLGGRLLLCADVGELLQGVLTRVLAHDCLVILSNSGFEGIPSALPTALSEQYVKLD